MNYGIFDLTGKTALVTGGNGGIGLGMALGMASAGAKVAICGRSEEKNNSALNKLKSVNSSSQAFTANFADIGEIPEIYNKISSDIGGVDILVNNAGIQRRGSAENIELKDFQDVMDINVTAPYVLSQCFAKERIAVGKGGCIIMTGSLMCKSSRPGTSPYTASKGAIRQLVKALAVDWAKYGIRVNGIAPGYIKTEMTRPLFENPDFDSWVLKHTPAGRWGNPDDFEGAVIFLASDAARFVTGQMIYIDGGFISTL